jgi:hypothetical protein
MNGLAERMSWVLRQIGQVRIEGRSEELVVESRTNSG